MTPRVLLGIDLEDALEDIQGSKPFILKLHGDWENSKNRVLTLEEYKRAYGNDSSNVDTTLPLPELLGLILKTRCLLFVGCSLAQDRTMRLLHQITQRFDNRITHFALVERPDGTNPDGGAKRKPATPKGADAATQKRQVELDALSIVPIWYPHGQHALLEPLLAYIAEQMEEVFPPATVPNNIPALGNPTVGRQQDVENIAARVAREPQTNRLITILGPGGCGKSRLAIELASSVKNSFPAGVWFVALADLSVKDGENNLLPSRIGSTIGVLERPKQPPNEALLEHFRIGKHLLILDNCEHLIHPCREIAISLLEGCPGLTVLATSRALLNASTLERVYPLSPLSIPAQSDVPLAVIAASTAVQLFVERARERQPDFKLDQENAGAVSNVCQALAGLPLAIEIAAALLSIKSVWEISEESSRLIDATAAGDLRHWNTMTAAIAWSYDLLHPDLQLLLRVLSVFVGGWTLPAACAVCPPELGAAAVESGLRSLIDSSLVLSSDVNRTRRFRFLEPILQFLRNKVTSPECDVQQRLHAEWFRNLAELSAPKMLTSEQNATLDVYQTEMGNFRAAITWAVAAQQPETALRLAVGLWRFTEIRGYYAEGLARTKTVLAIPGAADFPDLKAQLLSGSGMLAYRMANFALSSEFFQGCLDIATSRNDRIGMADAFSGLGLVAMMKGDFPLAQEMQNKSRDLEVLNNRPRHIAVATYNLGFIALGMGTNQDAFTLLNESLQQFESTGNDRESSFALNSLARCCIISADFETADRHAQKALAICRKLLDGKNVADTLRTLAWLSLETGQYRRGFDQLKEAIELARGADDSRGVSEALELFGLISARQSLTQRLVVLTAAAVKIRGAYGYALPPALILERDTALAKAEKELGNAEYSRLWARGGSLNITQAICEAVQEFQPGV